MNRKAALISTFGYFLLILAIGLVPRFEMQGRAPAALAKHAARNSPRLRNLLGEPRHFSRIVRGSLSSGHGDGNADLIIRIGGPLGRGALNEWAQEDEGEWHICSLVFQPSGRSSSILIIDGSSSHCKSE
jgi:hypothetical protein